jgi:hypothetical protein
MRVLIAIAVVLSVGLVMAMPADGQQRKARKPDPYTSRAKQSDSYARRAYEDSADCARAEALDPAGNYKSYPCWARKALSPQTPGGR